MIIRKYQEKDKENLRHICIATAKNVRNDNDRKMLTLLYNDYFTENESENIFVAATDEDEAIGYILCSTDFKKFKKTMKSHYLKEVWKVHKKKCILVHLELIAETVFSKKYPAFLHIDILDGYQRMGLGTKLMDALMGLLKGKGIPAVMLGVGADNEKGISFYKKYGFHEFKRAFGGVKMGYFVKDFNK